MQQVPPLLTQKLIMGSMQTLSTSSRLSPVPQHTPLAHVPANTGFALFITAQFKTNVKFPSMFELCSAFFSSDKAAAPQQSPQQSPYLQQRSMQYSTYL